MIIGAPDSVQVSVGGHSACIAANMLRPEEFDAC